jgi:uncharacterized protein (DUF433 family)
MVAFGRPIVRRMGVSTAAIADRIDAGETVSALAEDYDLSREESSRQCSIRERREPRLLH